MRKKIVNPTRNIIAVDLFCGAGGLTRGLLNAGIKVVAGYDVDTQSRFPFEHNNPGAKFFKKNVAHLSGMRVKSHFPSDCIRVLVGCAPCAPFSKYTQGLDPAADTKWGLLREFGRLIKRVKPDIVSMENVPDLQRHAVFDEFIKTLEDEGFHVPQQPEERIVYCPDYGLPQHRSRLVIVASKLGPINLLRGTRRRSQYKTVGDVLRDLPNIAAGEVDAKDPLHRTSKLSATNLRRIRASKPGGSWSDWPEELVAKCHKRKTGHSYPAVYGRMSWDDSAPTLTTQFFGFGSGRFGHPEQDRAISLREGAILQSFPEQYQFVKPGRAYSIKAVGRMIGNAVPVVIGELIGRTIIEHVENPSG